MEPKIYKPGIYKGAGIYKTGAEGGGGGGSYIDFSGTKLYSGFSVPSNDFGEDNDVYIQIKNSSVASTIIPIQTNNDNCIFSIEWGSYSAYKVFDNDLSSFWSTTNGVNTNQYCGFDFGNNPKKIKAVSILPRTWSSVTQMQDYEIQASNDGNTWVTLFIGTAPNNPNPEWQNASFENETEYRYYRLFVKNAYSSQTITIFEIYMSENNALNPSLSYLSWYKKVSGIWVKQ